MKVLDSMQNTLLSQKPFLRNLIIFLLILFPVAMIYSQTVHFDFVITWDDNKYVTENPYIQGLTWPNIKGTFTHFFASVYTPIQILSYIMDHALWEMDPFGYHLTNVLLHALNSIFLMFLIQKITRRFDVAFIASLIFAVHPVQVENIAWVSQRKSLLAATFFFISFYLFLIYSDSRRRGWYWGSVLLFGLSLLSKASTITLPVLLFFYEWLYRKKKWTNAIIDKLPYFGLSCVIGLLGVYSQTMDREVLVHGGTILGALWTTLVALKVYVSKIFLPFNLNAFRIFSYQDPGDPVVLASLGLLGILCFGVAQK